MFLGPLEVSKPWIPAGIIGVSRFLERLWAISEKPLCDAAPGSEAAGGAELQKLLHRTIKKVTDDTSTLNFNTAISAMMIYSSEIAKLAENPRAMWEPLVIMAGAYAPHLGEELWEKLGHKGSVSACSWPSYDERLTVFDEVTVVVQVNGKIRDKFTVSAGTAKDELEKTALAMPGIKKWLEGQTVVKVITVPDKLVNVVVKN
jgi:leucyl-tRNA synthetase